MSTLSKLTDLPDNDPQQRHDFERRYVSTYILVDGVPAYCRGFDGNTIIFYDMKGESFLWDTKKEPDKDVKPFLPETGYYNVAGVVTYLYKYPQRQWRRSFCVGLYTSDTYIIREGVGNIRQLVKDIIAEVYTSLDSITNPLFARVALNKKFAVNSNEDNIATLYYRKFPIATLDFTTFTVNLTAPTMKQEVLDLFKYTGVTKWKI